MFFTNPWRIIAISLIDIISIPTHNPKYVPESIFLVNL